MKQGVLFLVGACLLVAVTVRAGGIGLVVQEDYFTGTDRGYTDGTELMWTASPAGTNPPSNPFTVGLRNRMYAPDSIDAHPLKRTERAYCATLSVFYRIWRREGDETVKYEIEAGVLGPHAYGEELQTLAHRAIRYTIPQGWEDQLRPDEPVLNGFMDRYRLLGSFGEPRRWQARLECLYGGALGTTFINGLLGVNGRAGWNIPENTTGSTVLAGFAGGGYAFAFIEPRNRLVLHNATLGNSLFHDRKNERRLLPWVGEIEGGIVVGWNGLSFVYSAVGSSREFRRQNMKQSYGNFRVEYTWLLP